LLQIQNCKPWICKVHAVRPDIVAAAHAYLLYGKTWSSLGRLLDPLTQDACAFYEYHALFDNFTIKPKDMLCGSIVHSHTAYSGSLTGFDIRVSSTLYEVLNGSQNE
jgi:hypothetical protein